jgi:hypothetical protein
MVRAGVSEHVAMAITGHKTTSMFRRYNMTSTDDIRKALRLRDAYEQQTKKPPKVLPIQ